MPPWTAEWMKVKPLPSLSGITDSVATDRVIVAFGLKGDNSNGTSAAISRCGVTAIGTPL